MAKEKMSKRVFDAGMTVKPNFPKVFAFIYKYLPGAIKLGTDDLLAETLEQAASGKRSKDGTPILDYWGYCERAYEQKKMDRCAQDGEAEAMQTKLDLAPASGFFKEFAEFSKAKAEGRI